MPTVFKSPFGSGPITGIIDFIDGTLTIEFEKPRFLRRNVIEFVTIPAVEIDSIKFEYTRPRAKLKLRVLYLETLKALPWAKQLEASFTIPHREADRAIELEKQCNDFLNQRTDN